MIPWLKICRSDKRDLRQFRIDGILNWLIEINPKDYLSNVTWYALLGKKDQALDCLEQVSENPRFNFSKS